MTRRVSRTYGRVRPLKDRIEETQDKLDKLELQSKIQELRNRQKSRKRRK